MQLLSYSSKSGKDLRNRCVFRRWQKKQSIAEDWAAGGNEFQMTDAATGNDGLATPRCGDPALAILFVRLFIYTSLFTIKW